MSTLRQIEPPNNNNERSPEKGKDYNKSRNQEVRKHSGYCGNIGFPNRWHPESVCRTKIAASKTNKNDKIRVANNIEIQDAIAATDDAKNE